MNKYEGVCSRYGLTAQNYDCASVPPAALLIVLVATECLSGVDVVIDDECFIEVVDIYKIFQHVVVRLSHFSRFDQFEDHLTEVFCAGDSPALEDRNGHQAEVQSCQVSNTKQQLTSRDVPRVLVFSIATQLFLHMAKSSKHELISVLMVLASLNCVGKCGHSEDFQPERKEAEIHRLAKSYNETSQD